MKHVYVAQHDLQQANQLRAAVALVQPELMPFSAIGQCAFLSHEQSIHPSLLERTSKLFMGKHQIPGIVQFESKSARPVTIS